MQIKMKTKRRIYIFLAIILGILLAVIVYAFIDRARINEAMAMGMVPEDLPETVASIFLLGGVMLGYVLGVRWWQLVYVEKRHWRNKT